MTGVLVTSLRVVHISFAHFSLAGPQTSGLANAAELCIQAQKEEELIFVKDTASCLYHNH